MTETTSSNSTSDETKKPEPSQGAPSIPLSREEVRLLLLGPAIGLGFSAVLWLAQLAPFLGLTTFFDFFRVLDAVSKGYPAAEIATSVGNFVWGFLALLVLCLPAIVMLAGAVQMIRVRRYRWCWAGALAGVAPCTYCLPFSLPFGVWGIIVLAKSKVRQTFLPVSAPDR